MFTHPRRRVWGREGDGIDEDGEEPGYSDLITYRITLCSHQNTAISCKALMLICRLTSGRY